VTKDGKQLVAVQGQAEAGLYVVPATSKTPNDLKPVQNLQDVYVGWMKDGRLVVADWNAHVATMNADGSARNVIYRSDLPIQSLSVCAGDRVLIGTLIKGTEALNIYRLDISGGRATQVTTGKIDQHPACSPDGQYFVYTTLVNGKQVLMRAPTAGGSAKQLTETTVYSGAISPDNQQIAILTFAGEGVQMHPVIQLIPADGGAPIKRIDADPAMSGEMQFSSDGKALYYPVKVKGVSNMVRQSLDGGPAAPATDFTELTSFGFSYDWARNQLAITRGRVNSDVVVITQQAAQ